jgi:hypothetical protein
MGTLFEPVSRALVLDSITLLPFVPFAPMDEEQEHEDNRTWLCAIFKKPKLGVALYDENRQTLTLFSAEEDLDFASLLSGFFGLCGMHAFPSPGDITACQVQHALKLAGRACALNPAMNSVRDELARLRWLLKECHRPDAVLTASATSADDEAFLEALSASNDASDAKPDCHVGWYCLASAVSARSYPSIVAVAAGRRTSFLTMPARSLYTLLRPCQT